MGFHHVLGELGSFGLLKDGVVVEEVQGVGHGLTVHDGVPSPVVPDVVQRVQLEVQFGLGLLGLEQLFADSLRSLVSGLSVVVVVGFEIQDGACV